MLFVLIGYRLSDCLITMRLAAPSLGPPVRLIAVVLIDATATAPTSPTTTRPRPRIGLNSFTEQGSLVMHEVLTSLTHIAKMAKWCVTMLLKPVA